MLGPTVTFPSGINVPALGLGTWRMGEATARRAEEIEALRLGLDLGMSVIDTAEMYGEGATESLVGEAISGRREKAFLVSKVYPHNASRTDVVAACERSLKRLKVERIDLYLLHWRGSVPLNETIAGFADLVRSGKIREWGVSNFDVGDMDELADVPGGSECATNQILYNLGCRSPEWDLLPWCRAKVVAMMAYSPLDQGRLLSKQALFEIAMRHAATPSQVALAWLLEQRDVLVIPKAASVKHVRENFAAQQLSLTAADRAVLDRAFPPPRKASPLAML